MSKLKKVNEVAVGDVIQAPDQLASCGTTHGKVELVQDCPDRPGYKLFMVSPNTRPNDRVPVHLKADGVVPVD
jgi:hypothetical protein